MADSGIEIERGVEYASHDGQALLGDLYRPSVPGVYPTLLLIDGGGWARGSRANHRFWGPFLAQQGYVAFSADYRLATRERSAYPESVHDLKAAVQYLRGKGFAIKVDPDRIGAMGESAGGHLAALLALSGDSPKLANPQTSDEHHGVSTRLKVAVPVFGIFDLLPQWEHELVSTPREVSKQIYLGATPMENRDVFYEASPINWTTIHNNQAAFLIVWGTSDYTVDHRKQSLAFVTALTRADTYVRPVPIEGAPHFWFAEPFDEPHSHTGFLAPKPLRFLNERL